MELAIPLIALGGLFLVSNQKKREGFNSVNKYSSPNQYSDKYFKPKNIHASVNKKKYTDLAGNQVNVQDEQFIANMVPYYGKTKNIGENVGQSHSDQFLDSMSGAGTTMISKTETAPLFNPEDNMQWATGTPNQSDFYQSRVNPSLNMNNVKPFQEIHVGPGLNQGYTNQGSNGFNAGMEARSQWIDKTVNELRVATNPKQSFELTNHQGPAQTLVKNLGIQAKVEKKLPDAFFVNTPDRYLTTTTGDHLASTLRSIQPDPTVHRATTTQAYSGIAGNGGVQQQTKSGMFRADHRQQLKSVPLTPAGTTVPFANLTKEQKSYQLLPTNRSLPQQETFGGLGGLVSAITSPIMDLVRPTRKEDYVGLTRMGALGSSVPNAPVPETRVESTIKQTTLFSPLELGSIAYAPVNTSYAPQNHLTSPNNRDTTSVAYTGGASSILPQTVSYAAEYNATIHANRATTGRIAGGNIQVFTPIINQTTSTNRSAMQTSYTGGANAANVPMGIEQYGTIRQANKYDEPDRNAPDLLNAFRNNPYTQSLSSVA